MKTEKNKQNRNQSIYSPVDDSQKCIYDDDNIPEIDTNKHKDQATNQAANKSNK